MEEIMNVSKKDAFIDHAILYEAGCTLGTLFNKSYSVELLSFGKKRHFSFLYGTKDKAFIKQFHSIGIMMKNNPNKLDYYLGKLIGFPDCCINNYVSIVGDRGHFFGGSGKVLEDYWTKLNGKHDVFEIKYKKHDGIDFGLIGHIPCSPNCKESLKRLDLINKRIKSW